MFVPIFTVLKLAIACLFLFSTETAGCKYTLDDVVVRCYLKMALKKVRTPIMIPITPNA